MTTRPESDPVTRSNYLCVSRVPQSKFLFCTVLFGAPASCLAVRTGEPPGKAQS